MRGIGRFLKVSVFISGLFWLVIVIAVLIGQQQPPSNWSTMLHFNECELPCWIGIVPNQTTLAEARRKVREAYSDSAIYSLDEDESGFKVNYKPTESNFAIAFSTTDVSQANPSPQSIIQEIYILLYRRKRTDAKPPTIADLYGDLGTPETARLGEGVENYSVALQYKAQRVLVILNDLDCDKIPMNEEISSILLIDPPELAQSAWLSKPQRWQGFGRCYRFVREISP